MDRLKILVVDDESRMRKLVRDFLVKHDFDVVEAGDGEAALDLFYDDKDIALIILDVMMPKMNGWEVCREIRESSKVPIIMLTAKSDESDELMGFELGVDEYISKPFSPKRYTSDFSSTPLWVRSLPAASTTRTCISYCMQSPVSSRTHDTYRKARQAYDALTVEQQALVSNYDVLTAAEETLRILIEELPVSASFSAPEIIALSGQQVEIPVTVSGKFEAHTLEMHIGYDSTKLTVNEVVPGAILENTSMNVIDFTTTPGTIYVGALCADAPMTGNGIDENVLLTVKATVNPEFSGTTPVNVEVNRFVNLPVGGTVTDIEVHTTNGSVNASLPEYTLTYTVNGEFYAEQTYTVGAAITVPEYTVPEGYTFSGWVVPETMPAENLTVDAVLSINVYTVTFVDGLDGSAIAEVSVEHGSNVTAPAAPAHDGYIFTGWNGSLVNVTENRTVTAEYSLLGDVDGDGVVTSADALTVLRMSLGIIATPVSGSLDFSICDIDGSGDITSVDALLIIRKAMQSA